MKVRDSATGVASGSSQMAAASTESAKVSVEAASAIDEVTSTMHEMSIKCPKRREEHADANFERRRYVRFH